MNQPLYKSFCFPYNGDFESIQECIDKFKSYLFEFYGTDDLFRSARRFSYIRPNKFEKAVQLLIDNDIEFNYLLNSSILDDYLIREKELFKHLKYLKSIGIKTITVSSPYFLDSIKDIGFKVSTSIIQRINSETSVNYHETLGYNRIILDEDEIRNIKKITQIRKTTNLPIEIIINSGCLKYCPYRLSHWNVDSISHPQYSDYIKEKLHIYCKTCKEYWYEDPVSFLKSLWIRPEELIKYKEIGINLFKISGRTKPTKENLLILDIYTQQSWDGHVFDYLKPDIDPWVKFGISNIPNKDLDDFFNFFFEDNIGCNHVCSQCFHCNQFEYLIKRNKEFKLDRT